MGTDAKAGHHDRQGDLSVGSPTPRQTNITKHPTKTYSHKNKAKKPSSTAHAGISDIISVTQINLRHTGQAWSTLLSHIFGRRNPIIIASEPYAYKNNKLPKVHKDLISFYSKKGVCRPRAALLVHKHLANKCWELSQFTTYDQVAIQIKHDNKEIVIVSSYMDGDKQVPPSEMTAVVDYAKQNSLPLIVGSDTNSQHKLWGNKNNNGRGEDLLDYMDSKELSWSNKGSSPTFLNSRGHNSIIDLTITNDKGKNLVQNWHVSSKHSDSDHRYIFYDIASNSTQKPTQIRFARNTDWEIFNETLANNEDLQNMKQKDIQSKEDIDQAATTLSHSLTQAFEVACPITYISNAIKNLLGSPQRFKKHNVRLNTNL